MRPYDGRYEVWAYMDTENGAAVEPIFRKEKDPHMAQWLVPYGEITHMPTGWVYGLRVFAMQVHKGSLIACDRPAPATKEPTP